MQKYSVPIVATLVTTLAFILYIWTLAPGLTWAHYGADGGDFLAAAITNGVPHPSGYPLYILLLQGWLALWGWLSPNSSIAWQGNLLSALFGAFSAGVTVAVVAHLLNVPSHKPKLFWAGLLGFLWAISPLLWEQAVITEVYTLHALLITLLGWTLFNRRGEAKFLIPVIALGLANHLTFALLLPAAFYYLLAFGPEKKLRSSAFIHVLTPFIIGGLISLLFYLRIPLAATNGSPINWGYADSWSGFWWLISGQAYQSYLFDVPNTELMLRVAAWAAILTEQFTLIGLGLALLGLYHLDSQHPHLRNFGLLWVFPISFYALVYYTNDSKVYLLAPAWILLIWLVWSLPQIIQQAYSYLGKQTHKVLMIITLIGIVITCFWRLPDISLRNDQEAQQFIDDAVAVIEPSSIVITQADAETFALWYGAWASGELLEQMPDSVLINYPLYARFDWYRRSMAEYYAHIPAIGEPIPKFLAANQSERAIFFGPILVEDGNLDSLPGELEQTGVLWRYQSQE